jgi:hypothetical protein
MELLRLRDFTNFTLCRLHAQLWSVSPKNGQIGHLAGQVGQHEKTVAGILTGTWDRSGAPLATLLPWKYFE